MPVIKYLLNLSEGFERHLQKHRTGYIFRAVVFIACGILMMTLSGMTILHVEMLGGAAFLMAGASQMALTFSWRAYGWSLVSACITLMTGAVILWKPFPVFFTGVIILIIFMVIEAVIELLLSLHMPDSSQRNELIISALLLLVLAAITWLGYPVFDAFYLGLIVAANFILYGLFILMLVWKMD